MKRTVTHIFPSNNSFLHSFGAISLAYIPSNYSLLQPIDLVRFQEPMEEAIEEPLEEHGRDAGAGGGFTKLPRNELGSSGLSFSHKMFDEIFLSRSCQKGDRSVDEFTSSGY
ncbi:hypothetical protein F2Q68_00018343 [Brassica cretica]|uniref:Uncharacterized protein n=1 Tax=Brassica cretica TaxID=69181 RepID=A0A8S9HKH7_BRACR|nr:hypothetical protein F2Q68_00018343 [Brassica cretica]